MNVQPLILCGGSGTRMWPLSREQFPKQLLSLAGELSMLQATVQRLAAYSGESGHRFHAKLDTHSRANWTVGA